MRAAAFILVIICASLAAAAPPPQGAVRGAFRAQAVVEDSKLMQRIAMHADKDPRAVELAVQVSPDSWRSAGGATTHTDYYLAAPTRESLIAYLSELAADPKLAAEPGHELNFERIVGRTGKETWRSYYLDTTVVLDASDVAAAELQTDEVNGRPEVRVTLNDKGKKRFADFTTANVGHRLAIVVDERILSAPVIEAPIVAGNLSVIMGNRDPDELAKQAAALAKQLNDVARPRR